MAAPASQPVTEALLHLSLRSLAEDMLEADTTLHERVDALWNKVHSLMACIVSLERRIAQLEGAPECTDMPCNYLHELD